MTQFKDHFSGHAAHYREARPTYPDQLFATLAALAPGRALAWDAGCGNGQASVALADHFEHVHASDPSATQIGNAEPQPRVHYEIAPAEQCSLGDASADLVTVAQALHWFDVQRFHAEVRRVLKPGGVIAEWCYAECSVSAAVDVQCNVLYTDVLGMYWPKERVHVENGYADLEFPFQPLPVPPMQMQLSWTLRQYLAYLGSWSALQRFRRERGSDPLADMSQAFASAWGDPAQAREVRWQLSLRAGRHLAGAA
jgi:ubiquinone/menaquinone biosynthesis C-methylase UbiE